MYDFSRCKLCATHAAHPTYLLRSTTIYVCAACGFHFIDHLDIMPSDSPGDATTTLDRKSWDYIEGRLGAHGKQVRKNLRLVSRYHSPAGAHCLDVGAGAGLFPSLLAEAGAVVHGIEPQKIFREYALQRFGIPLHRETIDDRYWQHGFAGFFHIVTLWDVLEHVNFPAETIRDVSAVTKPGGWLFLDTPRRDSPFYRVCEWSYRLSGGSNRLLLESLYSPRPFRHKQLFTRLQLVKLVEEIGFTVIRLNSSLFMPNGKMVLVCRKPLYVR
jgi:2-polyprenyl-6-hydroxyphenyl methylase/3-demethylubiquinone-9 3-methyltransferase